MINTIIPYYNCPIDFISIFYSNHIKESIHFLIEKFQKNNINYIKLKLSKYKCSKNGNNFEIEIFKIDNGYILIQMKIYFIIK